MSFTFNKMKYLVLLFFFNTLGFSLNLEHKVNSRIIGGKAARAGQFPFIASIYTTTELGVYFCEGSLIHPQWLLTAGQCAQHAVKFNVTLGSNSLNMPDKNRVSIVAEDYFVHEFFDNFTLNNDIALIRFNKPVLLNDYIDTVLLPTMDLGSSSHVIAVGWGQTDDTYPGPVNLLQEVEMVSVDNNQCQQTYGEQILSSMICAAGSYNEGICIGDMGCPLVMPTLAGRRMELVASASFISQNGCESFDPSGFTRIFPYIDWIQNKIATYSFL